MNTYDAGNVRLRINGHDVKVSSAGGIVTYAYSPSTIVSPTVVRPDRAPSSLRTPNRRERRAQRFAR